MMAHKPKLLFLCTGNSCRSQMAEGLLRSMASDQFESHSAGLNPKPSVHPLAVKVMQEIGIDISGHKPKSLKEFLGKESIHYLVFVCNSAQRSCPRIWPGLAEQKRLYWPFDDPAEATGDENHRLDVFRHVRDEIKFKLEAWLKSLK